ncbi:hypothetical protein DL89DRAFT_271468, partial [Linderina pennispora]
MKLMHPFIIGGVATCTLLPRFRTPCASLRCTPTTPRNPEVCRNSGQEAQGRGPL